MRIVRIEAFPVAVQLRRPMRMAGRSIAAAETVLVRLITSDHEAGWGEANVATQLTGETRDSILSAVALIEERLKGSDARDLRRISEQMAAVAPAAVSARTGVDMALHDAVGRALGVSVSRLLGGAETLDAPMIGLVDPGIPGAAADCDEKLAAGIGIIKLKVANSPIAAEIEQVRSLIDHIAGRALIAADANEGWSFDEAKAFCSEFLPADLMFIEQPLPSHARHEMARLVSETGLAFGLDEALHGADDIARCRLEGLAAGVALKLLKTGGLTPLRDASALASGLGLAVNLSGKVGETSIANAAALHVASAISRPAWGVSLTADYLATDPVDRPLGVAGVSTCLAGPGLGVTVDERRLEALAVPIDPAAPVIREEAHG